MQKVALKRNEDKRVRAGHLWIFSNEIAQIEGQIENGDVVSVFDSNSSLVGSGFYNKNSLIAVRLLSQNMVEDFYEFAKGKIQSAYLLRKTFYPNRVSFRLIFSESDYLPGLIIDKYNNTFVLQINSYGIEKNIEVIVRVLKDLFPAENIFTKNESYFRTLEGLPEKDEIYLGVMKEEIISDGLINYKIDFASTQKTGFYFDQSDNRFFIERLCPGKNVLDVFCYSGGFGLHAAAGGAKSVTFVDSSPSIIQSVKNNFLLNKFNTSADFITEDAFVYFDECKKNNKKFDLVMIDPPAFAKNKKSLPQAIKGYEKLNKAALDCTENGGYFISSSCSYHLSKEEFLSLISKAAAKAKKQLQQVHFNEASFDHPKLPAMPETSYLKFAVFKVQ